MVSQVWSNKEESSPTIDSPVAGASNGSFSSSPPPTVKMPGSTSPTNNAGAPANAGHSSDEPSSGGGHQSRDRTKKRGLHLPNLKAPFKFIGSKTYCKGCKKKCSGEVLRVSDVYFHPGCFQCHKCQASLSQGGFFTKDKDYFCADCYQASYGTRCGKCGLFVEGEVISALGKTYHQACFSCAGCGKPFPPGERVTFTGKDCLCQSCIRNKNNEIDSAVNNTKTVASQSSNKKGSKAVWTSNKGSTGVSSSSSKNGGQHVADDKCAGCGEALRDGQALMALDKQYHVWCFKCRACDVLLHGEYMGKDGHPYCEKDYQQEFGVKCTYCRRFISGKVLQAGDNNHFHPTCARCTKCGEPFGDGEEMFLQGAAIWHPRCGPGPDESSQGYFVNGFEAGDQTDRASMASAPFGGLSRASSPGASLRRDPFYDASGRFSRSTMHMVPAPSSHWRGGSGGGGLYSSSSTYSLRRPLEPGDRMGSVSSMNHFHLPPSRIRSTSSSRYAGYPPSTPLPRSSVGPDDMGGPSSSSHRPISCPPKPGYTHSARSATLPSAISPGPGMHFNDFNCGRSDDLVSQQSFRTDCTADNMRGSHTYSHGFRSSSVAGYGRMTPQPFTGEHKTYPIHVLFTSNYKLPPDLDRCNLEKHLSDADFEMAFNMSRKDFYTMPLWRRNDLKKRVRLF